MQGLEINGTDPKPGSVSFFFNIIVFFFFHPSGWGKIKINVFAASC